MPRKLVFLCTLIFLLGVIALFMLPSLILAVATEETGMIPAFALPAAIALAAAAPALRLLRKKSLRFSSGDGFLLVFLTWVFTSLMGAIPYYLGGRINGMDFSFTDAFFESACGFATTGATTITDVESLPRSLLLWRSMSHWFGGLGIVLLTVALMPLLGVGGFQLIKAESPGPEKEKVTPKITATAKALWLFYCGLTVALVLFFRLGGMEWFDAFCHGFTIIASGGVSTRNTGLAFYNSAAIEATATVFMLLAAFNFNLYFRLLKGQFRTILVNTEARAYLGIFIVATAALAVILTPVYGSAGTALRFSAYQAASILSTTGSAITNFETWPSMARGIIFCLMFIGGCSASTAGGIKVIRHVVLWKQTGNEMRRILYPQGVFSIQLNHKIGRRDVVYGTAAFVFLYLMVVVVTILVTASSGLDLFSSLSAALSIVGNIGVGFGAIGPAHNYGFFPDYVKWFYSFAMIAGRLELWAAAVLFAPNYWRR
jgi:trk system potassium uptake protein TrkH